LDELEQTELNDRLMGADRAPIHTPAGPSRVEECQSCSPFTTSIASLTFYIFIARQPIAVEDDEEAQLKELQAALAM
jgi:charged multivesicular body protein 4A/B